MLNGNTIENNQEQLRSKTEQLRSKTSHEAELTRQRILTTTVTRTQDINNRMIQVSKQNVVLYKRESKHAFLPLIYDLHIK